MHDRNHAMESQKCNVYNFGDRSFLHMVDLIYKSIALN